MSLLKNKCVTLYSLAKICKSPIGEGMTVEKIAIIYSWVQENILLLKAKGIYFINKSYLQFATYSLMC
jgi:hypothetical protein